MLKKYPSVFLLILVVAGIILADQLRLPGWLFLLVCLILTIIGIVQLGRQKSHPALILFGLALFCFSGYHYSIIFYNLAPNHIANFVSERETYQIFGSVADWPNLKSNRTEIKIRIDSLGREDRVFVKGAIMLRISDTTTALQRGDRVEFRGIIYPLRSRDNPGSFDYARYLQLQGMFGVVYLPSLLDVRVDKSRRIGVIGSVDKIRHSITSSFNRNLSPPAAALASGILIGETRDIPAEIYNRFRDSGTLHLLAVSGSNVALVLIFLILVLRPFSINRKKRAVILIFCVFVFALLSYGEPSVIRASLMASLVLLATIIERRYDLNQIIATAAVTILLIDPTQLFSVGFQLSFVTAWGLIFITPKVIKLFQPVEHRFWFKWLALPVLISLIAQLCSAPLIAFYFGRVPAISVIANLFIIPLVSVSVVAVLVLLVLDLVWPMLGLFFGSLIDSFMQLVFYFLKIFGEDQTVILKTGDMPLLFVILLYGSLFFGTLTMFNQRTRRFAVVMIVIIVNIGLATSIVSAFSFKDGQKHLDIISIPGGIATIVKWTERSPVDIVVTGINSRDYPIEERILEPLLNELNINEIDRIFVLSAEYGAIDDLFRLAKKFNAKEIFTDSRLFNSFTDQANNMSINSDQIRIHAFFQKSKSGSEPGFYPGADNLTINFGDSEVRFLNSFADDTSLVRQSGKPTAVILGSKFDPIKSKITNLLGGEIKWVVCSKFEHSSKSVDINSLDVRLYDLDRQGASRLFVSDDPSKPFKIKTIH